MEQEILKFEVTKDELVVINNALNEVLNGPDAIDEQEFHSRMGVYKSQAESLLRRITTEFFGGKGGIQ